VEYYYTSYHKVHNAYSCGGVRIDGKNLLCCSWHNGYKQEWDSTVYFKEIGKYCDCWNPPEEIKKKWDENCVYAAYDFLYAIQKFFLLKIGEALISENMLVRMFAILDKRVGKRTLKKLAETGTEGIEDLPDWLRSFYLLRLEAEGIRENEMTKEGE